MVDQPPIARTFLLQKENLPYPWVHYPGGYYHGPQTFITFSHEQYDSPVLCECAKRAVDNAILLHAHHSKSTAGSEAWVNDRFTDMFPPSMRSLFPKRWFNGAEPEKELLDVKSWFENRFVPGICHRCNLATPTVRYQESGGSFMQQHGWYVEQTRYSIGAFNFACFQNQCPNEILDIWAKQNALIANRDARIERRKQQLWVADAPSIHPDAAMPSKVFWQEIDAIDQEWNRLDREWQKIPENLTRQDFGYKRIGEHWVCETMLFNIIRRLLPPHLHGHDSLIRNDRPEWLEGLELDIHLPILRLAIEYNGQQHYHPIDAWGGEEALAKRKENDRKKKSLCERRGVTLLVVKYTEPLVESHIMQRIKDTPWYCSSGHKIFSG